MTFTTESLEAPIFDAVHSQLRPLADSTLTGVGASALEILEIDADRLADVLSTRVVDNIELAGLNPDSALHPIAQLLSDERHFSSLLRELKRLRDAQASSAARPRTFSATVNLFDQNVTVPDGADAADLRLAITNTSDEHLRLRALVLNVAESRPSDVVRLKQAGAALTEFDLRADLTQAASVELLGGPAVQWVLRPDETDAFRIHATVAEGLQYTIVMHATVEGLQTGEVAMFSSGTAMIDYPIQSLAALRRSRGRP